MKILLVEDDKVQRVDLHDSLENEGHEVVSCASAACAWEEFNRDGHEFPIVITDLEMPGESNGRDLITWIRDSDRADTFVFVLTQFGSRQNYDECINLGADDFLIKPARIEWVRVALWRAGRYLQQRTIQTEAAFRDLVGTSAVMKNLRSEVVKMARRPNAVHIFGETGTGKEAIASALHDLSDRRDQPFVPINLSEKASNLVESELFGHAKSAFTDAKSARDGTFRSVGSGTIFLDEVHSLPLSYQAKLLRVVEGQPVSPVGSNESFKFTGRVVSAANVSLKKMVEAGEFREDLMYRLNVLEICVPPLRDRIDDIPELLTNLIRREDVGASERFVGFTEDAISVLRCQKWSGNVRELKSVVIRAVAKSESPMVSAEQIVRCLYNKDSSTSVRDSSARLEIDVEKWESYIGTNFDDAKYLLFAAYCIDMTRKNGWKRGVDKKLKTALGMSNSKYHNFKGYVRKNFEELMHESFGDEWPWGGQ